MHSCLVCRFYNQTLKPCKKGIKKQGFEQLRNNCSDFAPEKVIIYNRAPPLQMVEEIRRRWYNE